MLQSYPADPCVEASLTSTVLPLHQAFTACLAVLQVGEFKTPLRDGWGITTQDDQLVLSDGSSKLTWLSPDDLSKAVRSVTVTDERRNIRYLNEVSSHIVMGDAGLCRFSMARWFIRKGCVTAEASVKCMPCSWLVGYYAALNRACYAAPH